MTHSIERILFFLIVIVNLPIETFPQTDSLINHKQHYEYYQSGQMKKLTTYLNDTCLDGTYIEWYMNGNKKTEGNYKYITTYDSVLIINPVTYLDEKVLFIDTGCYKTGVWNEYDSTGKILKTIRYRKDHEDYSQGPLNDTIVLATKDSVRIRISDYLKNASYIIKRSANNKSLIIAFQEYSNHNYWQIYDSDINIFSDDESFEKSLSLIEKPIKYLISDDCRPRVNWFDFAKLGNGKFTILFRKDPIGFDFYVIIITIIDK